MDFGTIIIATFAVALCALPFILIGVSHNKRKNQLFRSVANCASEKKCSIIKKGFGSDFIIALSDNNYLFFGKLVNNHPQCQCIDLAEVSHCKLINTSRSVNSKNGSYKIIDKLELSFLPAIPGNLPVLLEFYNADGHIQLNGELQLMEEWTKVINECLSKRNLKKQSL